MIPKNPLAHVFLDMDATLCSFATPDGRIIIPDFNQPGLFIDRAPLRIIAKAIEELFPPNLYIHYILSATPTPIATEEKQEWLNRHFPHIPTERRFFVPFPNGCKGEFIANFCTKNNLQPAQCVLIDDTYDHLKQVELQGGLAIHPTHLLAKYEEVLDARLAPQRRLKK